MSVSTDYYSDTYGGIEFDDIESYLTRAEMLIDAVITVDPEEEEEVTCYSNAVCAQAEYIGLCGGITAWLYQSQSSGGGFTIGSFSMSGGSSSSGAASSTGSNGLIASALTWLEKGGLIYRGIPALP